MNAIDLNADVGEMHADLDARIVEVVTSVNIACGGHAGDDASMRRVATLAAERDVRIGAHPSYEDTAGFGRVRQDVPTPVLTSESWNRPGKRQRRSASSFSMLSA